MKQKRPVNPKKIFNFRWESDREERDFKRQAERRHMTLAGLIRQLVYGDIEALKQGRRIASKITSQILGNRKTA